MQNRSETVAQLMRIIEGLMNQGWDEVPLSSLEDRLAQEEIEVPNLKRLLQELVGEGALVIKHRLRGEMSLWPTSMGEGLRGNR